MKKLVVTLLLAAMTLSVVACGGNKENDTTEPSQSVVESGTEESSEVVESTESDEENGEAATSVTPQDLKDAVIEALGDDFWPNCEIPPEYLEETYGISPDMYDAYVADMPMISMNVDTLIVVQAKEGQVEAVKAVLDTYRDYLVNDSRQYPMNVGKIQASRVDVIDNFVCFILLGGDTMAEQELGDEAVITKCQNDNQTAFEAMKAVVEK